MICHIIHVITWIFVMVLWLDFVIYDTCDRYHYCLCLSCILILSLISSCDSATVWVLKTWNFYLERSFTRQIPFWSYSMG